MNTLNLPKTITTPAVNFNPDNGVLKIEGRSIPENPDSFYESLIQWLHEFYQSTKLQTRMEIRLEYVNSGTSKYLMEIFRILKDYEEQGRAITVNWFYEEEDEAMYDLGKHFQETIDLPIHLMIIY